MIRANAQAREEHLTPGASLILRGLTKQFDEVRAVDSVNIEVDRAEFITLLGPSGSGKTTTLQLIAGFLRPTAGDILVDSKPVTNVPPHKRDIGMVFQNYALFPHMTAAENVGFALKVRKVNKGEIQRRVAESLEMVSLADEGDRYPNQLSGGQQQRIAVARALIFHTKIVVLDEPLGALDKRLREQLQLELKRIQQELNVTMIFVTHDQEEALVLSDRIAVFNDGRIEQFGKAEELYEMPHTLFVANFIGESNIFRGTLSESNGQRYLSNDRYRFAIPNNPTLGNKGLHVALVVRPERLQMLRSDARLAVDENSVAATVREAIYLGRERKYILSGPTGENLISRHQAGTSESEPRIGEKVIVSWQINHGAVVADEG